MTRLYFVLILIGCGEKQATYQCTPEQVLQECDQDGNCTNLEDCAAKGLICHADMEHCMAMDTGRQ